MERRDWPTKHKVRVYKLGDGLQWVRELKKQIDERTSEGGIDYWIRDFSQTSGKLREPVEDIGKLGES